MCGICGIINFNGDRVRASQLKKMMIRMKHRGPDDEGIFIDNNFGLGFVRLSIIDLSKKGHQPMFDISARYAIIHNGEIFNFVELRNQLIKKGYKFTSNTDSEVILYSYVEWGEACLDKFNGMWAFVIYDKKTKTIYISRDRYGIKPFYYYLDNDKFIFASEIPPILKILENKPTPNNQSIFDLMIFNRTDQSEGTFFEGIKKLGPGHSILISKNNLKITKWYDFRNSINKPFRNSDEFRETLSSAIGLRLQSDVPVGICLSGGMDSSSIASLLLKDYNKYNLKTFSAVYKDWQRCDESEYIKEYRNILKHMHFTTPTAETLMSDMSNFMKAHGEPTPSAASYAQYKVMELAKDNIVVTLDGQGADEQLAGYHYYFGFLFKGLLRKIRLFKLSSEIYHYLKIHRSMYSLKIFLYHLLPQQFKIGTWGKRYLTEQFINTYSNSSTVQSLYDSNNLNESLINHFEKKLAILLKWEDRNSMWHSLESRVPFLDHRLVERTLSLPDKFLINKGMTKIILRESMKEILPEKIRLRKDKIGFGTPQDEWFREPVFSKYIWDMLNSREFNSSNIIDKKKAINLYKRHLDNRQNISDEIWKWINLDLWFKEFIY